MRKRWAVIAVFVGALSTSAVAQAAQPTCGDPNFGQHVSSMAPEHAIAHGHEFGACVSAMARDECPHC